MKKLLLSIFCVSSLACSAPIWAETARGLMEANNAGAVIRRNQLMPGRVLSREERAAISLIRTMYNTRAFENTAYLKRNCTQRLLKKLREQYAYEYDPDPDAYAVWLFRSGANGGISSVSKIIKVESLGNNWYQYVYLDMGVRGTNRVKIIRVGGAN